METRQKLYEIYKAILENQAVQWIDISGDREKRIQKAISTVDDLLKQ
jgi:nicotinamide riboside kinase